jgi:hypothetical protein
LSSSSVSHTGPSAAGGLVTEALRSSTDIAAKLSSVLSKVTFDNEAMGIEEDASRFDEDATGSKGFASVDNGATCIKLSFQKKLNHRKLVCYPSLEVWLTKEPQDRDGWDHDSGLPVHLLRLKGLAGQGTIAPKMPCIAPRFCRISHLFDWPSINLRISHILSQL